MRKTCGALLAALIVAATVGCAPSVTPGSTGATDPSDGASVVVEAIIDGDTIETSAGTVRVIGIDAPERGECGYDEASAFVATLLREGDAVTLTLPEGENQTDAYGRLLRYVDTAQAVDVGSSLLSAGLAVARFDSTDGYPAHPREADYRAAQLATLDAAGAVTTVDCKATAEAEAAQRLAEQQAAQAAQDAAAQQPVADEWWKQYSSCTKLKKNPNGHPTGPFSRHDPAEAAIYDWFANGTGNNGDGEGDGLACEG